MSSPPVEEAFEFILDLLRSPRRGWAVTNRGCDLWIPNALQMYLSEREGVSLPSPDSPRASDISTVFYDAAHELVRMGVLRQTPRDRHSAYNFSTVAHEAYTLTISGAEWLSRTNDVPPLYSSSRYQSLFRGYEGRYGPAFAQRALEAVRCHTAMAYLATCAMCGAAAESIILAAAVAKTNDEQRVIAEYTASRGRANILKLLTGSLRREVAGPLQIYQDLLSYWRDAAAHGRPAGFTEAEAYDALSRLLRLAIHVNQNWTELTA